MTGAKKGPLTVAGLFAGVGGIELGLERSGFSTKMICEIDNGAAAVLRRHFKVDVEPDVRALAAFPKVDLITAGFPCQDLSQAGRTAGISGNQSGLISEVFSRLKSRRGGPSWLLLENVPFMLHLQRGRAMRYLVDELERLGFAWAYRVVDTRAFGIPQRRRRVLLLASRTEDPRGPMFGADAGEQFSDFAGDQLCGFYWTEGSRGLGWAVDSIPTLKGGSAWGIPSPPAIWDPRTGSITTPSITDAERLQGFDGGWTEPATEVDGVRPSHRWKLVGNAVSVPVAQWIGTRLTSSDSQLPSRKPLARGVSWPNAAWGHKGRVYVVEASSFPENRRRKSLSDFLRHTRAPLSHRAASGFLRRALLSGLRFQDGFLHDVKRHVRMMEKAGAER